MDAVPILHDESLAYLTAASLIADSNAALSSAAFNLTSWPGLSNAAALKMSKNYTALLENDPLTASGDAVGAQIDAAFGPEVPKNDAKTNATVLIVEQNVHQVLRVVDRAYVLEAGTIRASGTAAELQQSDTIREAYLGV